MSKCVLLIVSVKNISAQTKMEMKHMVIVATLTNGLIWSESTIWLILSEYYCLVMLVLRVF